MNAACVQNGPLLRLSGLLPIYFQLNSCDEINDGLTHDILVIAISVLDGDYVTCNEDGGKGNNCSITY